jgi:hypothetical protein
MATNNVWVDTKRKATWQKIAEVDLAHVTVYVTVITPAFIRMQSGSDQQMKEDGPCCKMYTAAGTQADSRCYAG